MKKKAVEVPSENQLLVSVFVVTNETKGDRVYHGRTSLGDDLLVKRMPPTGWCGEGESARQGAIRLLDTEETISPLSNGNPFSSAMTKALMWWTSE